MLFISFYDLDYNGRTRELINALRSIGELFTITKTKEKTDVVDSFDYKVTEDNYFDYLREVLRQIRSLKKQGIDIIVIDDRKAVIPGRLAKWILGAKIVIQDCRELYTMKDVHHLAGKIGCLIEQPAIKKADVLICANQERAEYMKDFYHLTESPISYENIRKLNYSEHVDFDSFEVKYKGLFPDWEIRILTTAGCRLERTNDVLVRNMRYLPKSVRLVIVGEDALSDRQEIERIIEENGINNITILGRLKQEELKYVTKHCHIGVVNYHQNDLNNKYCASGKLYEFLFEGLPVITTTNPPLKNMCEKYGVGFADDEYYSGIKKIIDNYEYYKKNVSTYISKVSVEANNIKLAEQLRERLCKLV